MTARLDSGESAGTPVQAVTLDPRVRTGGARGFHRFTLHDEAWDPQLAALHVEEGAAGERKALVLRSPGAATLALPDDLAGAYDIHLELRGDEYQGAPIASIVLEAGGDAQALADLAAPADWSTMHAATAEFARGSKRLVIAFRDDLDGPEGVGRALWLQAVVLHVIPEVDDRLRHYERLHEAELREIERLFGHEGHGLEVAVQARERLKQLGLEAERKVREGDPATEILAEIQGGHYDLVVLASDGAGTVEDPRLGSVAAQVLRQAQASVLVVRAGARR